MIKRLRRNSDGSVAIETAIFTPIFLVMMLAITDLGGGMFVRMQVNAATQAGATYAVLNSTTPVCSTFTQTCVDEIEQAMNDASGNSSFCASAVCTASMSPSTCTAGSVCVITVSATYPYTPILSDAVYSWASSKNLSSTITLRIQ